MPHVAALVLTLLPRGCATERAILVSLVSDDRAGEGALDLGLGRRTADEATSAVLLAD